MNLLRAEHVVRSFSPSCAKLAEVYDDDDMLRDALGVLFPDFEYPDYSHLTIAQVWAKYMANPRPLLT